MVWAFPGSGAFIDERIRVHSFISIELERRSVKFIGAAARDHIDDAAARAANFGREGIGIHLKFLHRILAEGIRPKAGAPRGLTIEKVIRVRAVH